MKRLIGLLAVMAAIAAAGCSPSGRAAAERSAQVHVDEQARRITGDIEPMAKALRETFAVIAADDPKFAGGFARELADRGLSEAALAVAGPGGKRQAIATANLDQRGLGLRLPPEMIDQAEKGGVALSTAAGDRIEAVVLFDRRSHSFLYVSRRISPAVLDQLAQNGGVLPAPSGNAPAR